MRVVQERFRIIIEHVPCGTIMLNAQAHILYVNRYVSDALGYTPHEIIGRSVFYFTHPQETRLQRALFDKTLNQSGDLRDRGYARFRNKCGIWVLFGARVINLLDDPNVGVIIAFVNDESAQMDRYISNSNNG